MAHEQIISVTVVEDDDSFRNGVCDLINQEPGMKCNAAFDRVSAFRAQWKSLDTQVFWLDIHLPDGTGIELIREIKSVRPQALCIICSLHDDDEHVFQALKAGADGYLIKNAAALKIIESIRELVAGGSPMSAFIARKVMQSFREPAPPSDLDSLTDRENQVLKLIAKGSLYKEVADELNISTETVKKHLRHIYQKLQVKNRTEAVLRLLKD